MARASFVDFKAVKAVITMEQVLQHYGILDRFKKSGDSLNGPCPVHKGTNPTQFRVSLSKNIWNCFSECKHGGNVLDFIARMEDVSVHAAALKAIEWFKLDPEAVSNSKTDQATNQDEAPPASKNAPKRTPTVPEKTTPNPVLKFRLDKLEREHPYLIERGLTLETLIDFGVGFCGKGMMAGRVAIPIHNVDGNIVAYAGRWPGEPTDADPKYKLPPGFRKSLELFNVDRAIKEPADRPLVIVEGFFDCMKLWQAGVKRVVALMGSTLSPAQEELIRRLITPKSQIIVMLDEDEAGRAGREDIAVRLSRFAFVRVHVFEQEGMQPEHLTAEQAAAIFQ